MSADKRRALFNSLRQKMIDAGLGFESDPSFENAVEQWIDGELPIAELRNEYLNLLVSREDIRRLEQKARRPLRSPKTP
ncbi:hypothetical protein [Aliirhizobium cellulosilyticum]|uniref:Antitoxin VbhA domain-containing protein n=1 Tax=Aliirhizobium cellulosilyticum TaxID=393664 RepID=A0A7W6WQP2_9HYPH|nr:hypothetical protein [Rhizobium cellulosilyticum]MBB4349336.1 hypothetical protein [Rhizobium cellulosilyticum]MBB4412442.1 hypothetical protein [Rhizobium cellulosilyticum]MBB4447074.1 hypothetical protein [Rhizobium cellulosilyticum]